MSNTWFISDTHFHHKNIIKYEPMRLEALVQYEKVYHNNLQEKSDDEIRTRILEMLNGSSTEREIILCDHDRMLEDAWNSIVEPADTVWFLGDFCLCDKDYAHLVCSRLNGRKRMIKGNHDNWSDDVYRDIGFEYVSKYPILLKHQFILSHAPLAAASEGDGFYFVYGHVHSHLCELDGANNAICACVERHNFVPFRIEAFDKTQ